MVFVAKIMIMTIIFADHALLQTMVTTDYDLYGIKIAVNDVMMIEADNMNLAWYSTPIQPNSSIVCVINYTATICNFVYSVVMPISNSTLFAYNCIDLQGKNVVGFFAGNTACNLHLINEQIISNYSTQYNFVITLDGNGTGMYGFADDFVFFYELQSPFQITVWSNTFNISPRAMDIGSNMKYAVVVGYCQSTPSIAIECGCILALNSYLSLPNCTRTISITNSLHFNWSDPRSTYLVSQSRVYSTNTLMSVSTAWRTRQILIGIPCLNIVLLYRFDNVSESISTRQNGIGLSGFGKSVAWLDYQGTKAVILANSYVYSTSQWISSSVHIYDIKSDGFRDDTQPVLIYPNGEQILFSDLNIVFIRITCSISGHLAIFDTLGNGVALLSAPSGMYPDTNVPSLTSLSVPCIPGTHRNYSGLELCTPCPNGTFSSDCKPCTTNDSFCPYGSIQNLSFSTFESIEQDQDYPEAPESTVFDDLLMQNMFSLNTQSAHCVRVSPMTWTILVVILGTIIAIFIAIFEAHCPKRNQVGSRFKKIFLKVDLIGEGEFWIGGLISTGIIVLIVSAYVFSNAFLHQYPIESITTPSSFACDVTLYNAKFSTTMQMMPGSRRSSKQNQAMFDLLNLQPFYLKIDLVQTAFTCQDKLVVYRLIDYALLAIPISNCEKSHNGSILSLSIPLPSHEICVQLILPGLRTVGAIRVGLFGPSAVSEDSRYTLLELNFASTFVPSSLDEVLAPSTSFDLQLTPIVNQTAPLSTNGLSTFSAIWSSSFNVQTDELFASETRYTFFQRMQTNITITVEQTVFYVSNVQEPIARQTEIVFHTLLFTIVVLEIFGLLFLLIRLLVLPQLRMIISHVQQYFLSKRHNKVNTVSNLTMVRVNQMDSKSNDTTRKRCSV